MLVLKLSSKKLNPKPDPFPGAKGRFEQPYGFDEVLRQAPLLAELVYRDQEVLSYKVQGVMDEHQSLRRRRGGQSFSHSVPFFATEAAGEPRTHPK